MYHFVTHCALSFLAATFFVGCSSDEPNDTPQNLTLYSIDGTYEPGPIPKEYEGHEKLQGYPILGKSLRSRMKLIVRKYGPR